MNAIPEFKSAPHDSLKAINWLIGEWRTDEGSGKYATISPFKYSERISFTQIGQPMLNYSAFSWNDTLKKPMHLENGFLRTDPQSNQVFFNVTHNFGLTTVEEGTVNGNTIELTSKDIGRISAAKGAIVKKITRSLSLEGDFLVQKMSMETDSQELQDHLITKYVRV